MPRVLVTGSAGFVGGAFVRRLLEAPKEAEVEVVGFDLDPTTIDGCRSLEGTILDEAALSKAVRGCEFVVHLAAFLGVELSDTNRAECLDTNILGTRHLFEACVEHGVRKVLFVSSSEVYGDTGTSAVSETSTLRPKSVYAVSKLAGEEYLRAYAGDHGFDHTVVRLFNAYGPRQRDDFVMPRFALAALARRAPHVYGTGAQLRAFCSVEDIAEGMRLALFHPDASGEAFNLGNEAGAITVLELARKVVDLAGCGGPPPELVGYEQADRPVEREIQWRVPDVTKAKTVLGYRPRVSLDDGIRRLLEVRRAMEAATAS